MQLCSPHRLCIFICFINWLSTNIHQILTPEEVLHKRCYMKQDNEEDHTKRSSLCNEAQNYTSELSEPPLPRGVQGRTLLSTDSPFSRAAPPAHTTAFLTPHRKPSPSLSSAGAQTAISKAPAHQGGPHGKAGGLAKPQRRLPMAIRKFGHGIDKRWSRKRETWKEVQRHVMKRKKETAERSRAPAQGWAATFWHSLLLMTVPTPQRFPAAWGD